jgi:DNA-binding SARP family transcriptional activator/streptogramin lyase
MSAERTPTARPRGRLAPGFQEAGIEFRILGPLEVELDGQLVLLGPPKQRALLAWLLLHANRVASRDRIVDALWGERPPETAVSALQGYIAGLRKAIGADRIETRTSGYRLRADPSEIDLARFQRLIAEAGSLEPQAALLHCDQALALWRDLPLTELDSVPFVEAERRRLEELRLAAMEQRHEAKLSLGHHAEIVADLTALVSEHPLRERMRSQLMLALYRSARQSEALDVYREGRHMLAGELGLEPGEPLRRLERAVLERDPSLDLPLGAAPPPSSLLSPRPSAGGGRGRRRSIVVAAACLAAFAAAAAAFLVTRSSPGSVAVAPNSVAVIDPRSNRIVADIPVDPHPVAVAFGEGAVWVASGGNGIVRHIDPRTRRVVGQVGLGTDITSLAVGFGALWVANGNDGTVTRIDPAANGIQDTIRLGGSDPLAPQPVFLVATGAGAVWATSGNDLVRIDPKTDRVLSHRPVPNPRGLAAGSSGIWLTTVDERLLRIPPGGLQAQDQLTLPVQTAAPTLAEDAVWLILYQNPAIVTRVDPASLQPGATSGSTAFPSLVTPEALAVDAHAVWSVDPRGVVTRFDPADLGVERRIRTGVAGTSSIAVGGGLVWVAVSGAPGR